jgi:hypothetical protein
MSTPLQALFRHSPPRPFVLCVLRRRRAGRRVRLVMSLVDAPPDESPPQSALVSEYGREPVLVELLF